MTEGHGGELLVSESDWKSVPSGRSRSSKTMRTKVTPFAENSSNRNRTSLVRDVYGFSYPLVISCSSQIRRTSCISATIDSNSLSASPIQSLNWLCPAISSCSAKQFRQMKSKFHLARHVTSRHVERDKPMHFGCVEFDTLVSTRSTCRTCQVMLR